MLVKNVLFLVAFLMHFIYSCIHFFCFYLRNITNDEIVGNFCLVSDETLKTIKIILHLQYFPRILLYQKICQNWIWNSRVMYFFAKTILPKGKIKRCKLEATKSSLFRNQKFCIGKKYVTFRTKSFKSWIPRSNLHTTWKERFNEIICIKFDDKMVLKRRKKDKIRRG